MQAALSGLDGCFAGPFGLNPRCCSNSANRHSAMKSMKSMFALLPLLSALAAFPGPAAAQEMECKMCKECQMCEERMEKMKGTKEMKEDMKPMERMEKMKDMRPMERMEKMQGMPGMPPMEHMKKMQQMMQRKMQMMQMMQRQQGMEHKMPPPSSGEGPDVKQRLAEADLAAVLQQYQKVRMMEEETKTELKLLEQTEGQGKEMDMLSKRAAMLWRLAEELRGKAEDCCAMDGKKEKSEPSEAHEHDHGDKGDEAAKHDQKYKAEAGKASGEPHH